MRTDWLLNDDCVLDGGSDWFGGVGKDSGMKDRTIPVEQSREPSAIHKIIWTRWVFHSRLCPAPLNRLGPPSEARSSFKNHLSREICSVLGVHV